MAGSPQQREWIDGFLFVGNHLALDFVNTKPILEGKARELLSNPMALEKWLTVSGVVMSQEGRALVRIWRDSRKAENFLRELVRFRERLLGAILRIESGRAPGEDFLAEVNELLSRHPQHVRVVRQGSQVVREVRFEPRNPSDVWAPITAATADLLAEVDRTRIRKCELESCVVHFYDTSKKGSRRWCSMNLCGNRSKVAAYQKRLRQA